jgi:hypothetical protein
MKNVVKKYKLYRIEEDGTSTEIASAVGSPFWTEMVYLAERMYGEKNVRITFGEE